MEKYGDIEPGCQIWSEGNGNIAAALHGDDAYSDDATDHIREEQSQEGDFRTHEQAHEYGYSEVSSAHPCTLRYDDLQKEKSEYDRRSQEPIGERRLQPGRRQCLIVAKEIDSREMIVCDEREKDQKKGKNDLIRNFHVEQVVHGEYDRYESSGQEDEHSREFDGIACDDGLHVYEVHSREQKGCHHEAFQKEMVCRNPRAAVSAFSSKANERKDGYEVQYSERVVAFRTSASFVRHVAFFLEPWNERGSKAAEDSSEYGDGDVGEGYHVLRDWNMRKLCR
jgi:hypothetical protein